MGAASLSSARPLEVSWSCCCRNLKVEEKMLLASLLGLCGIVAALPFPQDEDLPPMPYQFTNRVSEDNAELEEEDRGIYWTQDEGEYSVWLADGRLMTVSYYVDGESGFVPTITY